MLVNQHIGDFYNTSVSLQPRALGRKSHFHDFYKAFNQRPFSFAIFYIEILAAFSIKISFSLLQH